MNRVNEPAEIEEQTDNPGTTRVWDVPGIEPFDIIDDETDAHLDTGSASRRTRRR